MICNYSLSFIPLAHNATISLGESLGPRLVALLSIYSQVAPCLQKLPTTCISLGFWLDLVLHLSCSSLRSNIYGLNVQLEQDRSHCMNGWGISYNYNKMQGNYAYSTAFVIHYNGCHPTKMCTIQKSTEQKK